MSGCAITRTCQISVPPHLNFRVGSVAEVVKTFVNGGALETLDEFRYPRSKLQRITRTSWHSGGSLADAFGLGKRVRRYAARTCRSVAYRRHGFSLIELVVVIALMGMLASLATMSIHGVIVRQRLSRAAEVVEQFDTALRRSALVQRRDVTGVIDRNRHRLFVDSDAESPMTFKLPNHVEIGSVRYGSSNQSVRGNRVTFNEQGVSPSYAVRLDSGTNQRWVLLVGGTGQIVHDLDRGGVEAVLEGR